jgi:cell division transport system permease protein
MTDVTPEQTGPATATRLDGASDEERMWRKPTAIVPEGTTASTALLAVVAIMTFLAGITVGLVLSVSQAADRWAGGLSSEITIQIDPVAETDPDEAAAKAVRILANLPGILRAEALAHDELSALLEPWLGSTVDFDALPVPRLVVAEIDRDNPPDTAEINRILAAEIPGAGLDDHRVWQSRLEVMAESVVVAGMIILVLVTAATMLSITFATSGTLAANRDIVRVLSLVGAREGYIAGQFVQHFLTLGLKGSAIGGAAAILVLAMAAWFSAQLLATPAGAQMEALFGGFNLPLSAYIAVLATILAVAGITAGTAWIAVVSVLRKGRE